MTKQKEITIKPIGLIHTPYTKPEDVPIQGKFNQDVIGSIELFPDYQAGLKDIEGFSHVYLIFHLDRAQEEKLMCKPFLEDIERGVFSTRSPMRPNHIGLSIVKIEAVKENTIVFSEVDILDQTPLLDIKPYVSHFDSREDAKNGWINRHFEKDGIPARALRSGG